MKNGVQRFREAVDQRGEMQQGEKQGEAEVGFFLSHEGVVSEICYAASSCCCLKGEGVLDGTNCISMVFL